VDLSNSTVALSDAFRPSNKYVTMLIFNNESVNIVLCNKSTELNKSFYTHIQVCFTQLIQILFKSAGPFTFTIV
jgi:hypothetical protein